MRRDASPLRSDAGKKLREDWKDRKSPPFVTSSFASLCSSLLPVFLCLFPIPSCKMFSGSPSLLSMHASLVIFPKNSRTLSLPIFFLPSLLLWPCSPCFCWELTTNLHRLLSKSCFSIYRGLDPHHSLLRLFGLDCSSLCEHMDSFPSLLISILLAYFPFGPSPLLPSFSLFLPLYLHETHSLLWGKTSSEYPTNLDLQQIKDAQVSLNSVGESDFLNAHRITVRAHTVAINSNPIRTAQLVCDLMSHQVSWIVRHSEKRDEKGSLLFLFWTIDTQMCVQFFPFQIAFSLHILLLPPFHPLNFVLSSSFLKSPFHSLLSQHGNHRSHIHTHSWFEFSHRQPFKKGTKEIQ